MAESFEANINEFLKDARNAIDKDEWERARESALKVQAFDPTNAAAASILAATANLPGPTNKPMVDEVLAQAQEALKNRDWYGARERAIAVRALDPHNVDAARIIDAASDAPSLTDPQSGRKFLLRPESARDWWCANVSFVYQIVVMLFLTWMTVDTLLGKNTLLEDGFGFDPDLLDSDTYRTLAMTFIAGALGGALDAVRSLTRWHSEVNAYSGRFLLRDLAMPLSGAVLAVIVYAIVRSGAGVLSGDFSLDGQTLFVAIMSASAIGFAAGFNSLQVYRWIDDVANRQFSTKSRNTDQTPTAAATPAPATPGGA